MKSLRFGPLDGGLRVRLDEHEWAVVSDGVPDLLTWARVLPGLSPAASSSPTAVPAEALPADALPADALPADALPADALPAGAVPVVDAALRQAVELRAATLVELEVTAATPERTALAVLWSDGRVGSVLVRSADVAPPAGPSGAALRPGVEVSVLGADRLLFEILRLVPDAPALVTGPAADVPEELTVALAAAASGDRSVVDALCAELGLAGVPAVVEAAAGTASGSLSVRARSRGRRDESGATWLRCDAGWVQVTRTDEGLLRHTPWTRQDVADRVLADVSDRLAEALRVPATRPSPPPSS